MKPFYWFTRTFLRFFFGICYRHKVYGQENIFPGRGIIAPNHTSFLDPPLIGASWPEEVAFLARKSLFASSFFGFMISKLNAYPVTGTAQDLNSIKLICQLLQEEKKVVIFPEGIRSRDGGLNTIKSGISMLALRNRSPIIPVYIDGCYQIWNRTRRFPRLWGKTACVIGTPIRWEGYTLLDKKGAQEAMAEQVKKSIQNLKSWYEAGAKGSPP